MSAFSALDRGTRVTILLLGGALLIGVGYLGWQMTRPAPVATVAEAPTEEPAKTDPTPAADAAAEPPPTETAAATPEPAAEPAAEPPAEPAPEPAAEAPARPAQPVIDTWRVTAEGEAVVSGKAEPGAKIEVIVDDKAVASGDVTDTGDFAILFTLAPNPKPSLMWLSMAAKDQDPILSEEMVALGPIEGPKPAAEPETEAVAAVEPAEAPPALLLSDEGAVVLQDSAPEAPLPTTVMIDTIAYTPAGEVQVGGRGAPGAGLRLYLDNAEKTTLQVPATGLWVTTLPDTAPGVYTLRVDQLDASGKVTSRFETPFKRETLEALAAASGQDVEPAPEPSDETEAVAAAETEAPVQPQMPETAPTMEPAAETVASADSEPTPAPAETAAQDTTAAVQPTPEPVVEPVAEATPQPAAAPITVTVQPGFTLWGIAQERMGDGVMYVQVFEANKDKIKDPDLIYPGQVFTMPEAAASP